MTDPFAHPPLECDLLVVGGGVNGAGIARDAAGRGLSVVLCEQHDLASHTSSASTKLIHGGLRYLEHYEFGLVRKALAERELLLKSAPHLMWPLRFVMPHDPSMRPAWLIRAGLLLYDHLARRDVSPASRAIRLGGHPAGAPLKPEYTRGFAYSDGWVDDARLVVACALDAADRGARILVRTGCHDARRKGGHWVATLRAADGVAQRVRSRALVNATGPWAARFLETRLQRPPTHGLRLVKGSHIVVRRRFGHPYAYIFQHPDGRIVFAIPYEHDYTLVGTTDVDHPGDPGEVAASMEEIEYLCALVSRYFARPITPADVVHTYAGVRPLLDDASGDAAAVTRDYALEVDTAGPPLLTVWGGKITTFRKLAEEAVDRVAPSLGCRRASWTAQAVIAGGDLGETGRPVPHPQQAFAAFVEALRARRPWLPAPTATRLARAYGRRVEQVLGDARALDDLGAPLAADLREAELRYLVRHEWAHEADDVLWRRSKLGLHADAQAASRVAAAIAALRPATPRAAR